MAKITNPLHSLSASGTVGELISFRATRKGSVATKKAKSYLQQSTGQLTNQQIMRSARITFKALNAIDRGYWQDLAIKLGHSAWSCFFAEYQYQMIQPPNFPLIPEPIL